MPPWSQKDADSGFEDPYVFSDLAPYGLMKNVEDARRVVEMYAPLYSPSELEILFVGGGSEELQPPTGAVFLGYDVASSSSPFWSVVGDPPLDPYLRLMLRVHNANGLFDTHEDAVSFLNAFWERKTQEMGPMRVWAVYRMA